MIKKIKFKSGFLKQLAWIILLGFLIALLFLSFLFLSQKINP